MGFGIQRTPVNGVSSFVGYTINWLFLGLLFVVIYFLFRLLGLLSLFNAQLVSFSDDAVLDAFVMGIRYDIKVVSILMLPLVLFGLPLFWFKRNYRKWLNKFTVFYALVIGIIILFIELVNLNYFRFFKNQINVEVFGIFYDDTTALIHSILADFPVVMLAVSFVVVAVIVFFLIRYLVHLFIFAGSNTSLGFLIAFVPLLLLGARGSFGTFPLQKGDRAVSPNRLVNELVMNGFYALIEAEKEFSKGRYFTDENEILKIHGFGSLDDVIEDYGFNFGSNAGDSLFFHRASIKPDGFKNPNVVVIFMEGMGTSYFWPKEFLPDHLGKLGEQLSAFDAFYKCMPGGNLTVSSLESFVLGTFDGPLCQSRYSNTVFASSIAAPFAKAGYKNSFITGGKLDWRNFGSFLLTQGFHESVGMEMIEKQNLKTEKNEWGVFDEYLFDYVYNYLEEPAEEPKFTFVLTTTNHTPYDLPRGYVGREVDLLPFAQVMSSDSVTFKKNLQTYFYAANQVGAFMEKIRKSALADNTIVAITGDHTIRHNMMFPQEQVHKNYAVPLLLYVPKAYKIDEPDVSRWVSHRDINNTLCELALSDVSYFGTGTNIYGSIPENYYAVNNRNLAVSDIGISDLKEGRVYEWFTNDWNGRLQYVSPGSSLLFQQKSLNAYVTLLRISQARNMNPQ